MATQGFKSNGFDVDSNGNTTVAKLISTSYVGSGRVFALPTPDVTYRRQTIVLEGATGTADKVYVCLKTATETYVWVQVATG